MVLVVGATCPHAATGQRSTLFECVEAGSALDRPALCLSAHLSALLFPDTLRRLYIARDNDPAGDGAMTTLIERANAVGIEAVVVSPRLGDFNEDLRLAGLDSLRAAARVQIAPHDVARFMALAA